MAEVNGFLFAPLVRHYYLTSALLSLIIANVADIANHFPRYGMALHMHL